MAHTREEVIQRTIREYRRLDRLVARLTTADWRRPVPRPETKEPWTVKDALAHITYWKEGVALSARGKRRPPGETSGNITESNHRIFERFHRWPARKVLEWHRQVQADLLKALREAPEGWFTRPSRSETWPFDLDGHSAEHRVKDIEGGLSAGKRQPR